jgi:hypothetical protein
MHERGYQEGGKEIIDDNGSEYDQNTLQALMKLS